ncbi:MAG: STAS domain-containing protein [Trueperaceae bacterium]|nr:MAG: STAS domain-containing protein [Trueperaceae bacterium]
MELNVKTVDQLTVVEPLGDIDGKTAPTFQEEVLALIEPGSRILIDMSGVSFMSSAGLRVMLLTHRKATESEARIVLVGLNENILNSMTATGFINFFTVRNSLDEGREALG